MRLALVGAVKPPGHEVKLMTDGIPERASMRDTSPYYWPEKGLVILLGGKKVARCIGFDRTAGYVEVLPDGAGKPGVKVPVDDAGRAIPLRLYGTVEVTRAGRR